MNIQKVAIANTWIVTTFRAYPDIVQLHIIAWMNMPE